MIQIISNTATAISNLTNASAVIMMVVGAALNAKAFAGSMYLRKYLVENHADAEYEYEENSDESGYSSL